MTASNHYGAIFDTFMLGVFLFCSFFLIYGTSFIFKLIRNVGKKQKHEHGEPTLYSKLSSVWGYGGEIKGYEFQITRIYSQADLMNLLEGKHIFIDGYGEMFLTMGQSVQLHSGVEQTLRLYKLVK